MKKWVSFLIATSIVISVIKPITLKAATEYVPGQLYTIECTAYCDSGETATGTKAREGIAAFGPDYFGWVAVVTMPDGENHIFTIEDTGSEPIRNGQVLDIWMESEEECIAFGRQKLRCFFVKGQG